MPKFVADLHIHSHYSRATSQDLDLEHLSQWAQLKGVQVVATGDIAHPGWLAEMQARLEPAEEGLYRLKAEVAEAVAAKVPPACQGPVRFLLGGEVSNIYKRDGQVRKVHHLIFLPSFAAVERLQAALEKIGNIRSDGRPILGLDSRDLLEIVLETDPQGYLIPAHIWTPWFAVLGSKSGFDSIDACFGDLTPHIFALETGLSSDPLMNWRLSALDRYTLVSNSDAHSPPKLAREATLFDADFSYAALFAALKSGDPATFGGTLEFFPEEGKYHVDGHRACGIRWEPEETAAQGGICSVCGKPVTIGVLNRVASLADRAPGERPPRTHPYQNLIPLPEILGEVYGVGAGSRQVQQAYEGLLARLGPELRILREFPLAEIEAAGGALLAEGIRRVRGGEVQIAAGYDGEYGVIKLFEPQERAVSKAQLGLFGAPAQQPRTKRRKDGNREEQSDAARPTAEPIGDLFSSTENANNAEAPTHPPPITRENPSHPPNPQSILPPSTLLAALNAEQRAAASCIDTSLLIVAGPGTGKTRTLTHRIAYLIAEQGISPEAVLAITFTNKAAEEMAERLAALLPADIGERVTVQTFHAFAATLLRQDGGEIDLPPNFVIASEADQRAVVKQLYPDWSERTINGALDALAEAKNQLQSVDEVDASAALENGTPLADFYRAYDATLRRNGLIDFDDLILLAVRLLASVAAVQRALQARYRWLSVDEYQDINLAQYRLLRLLVDSSEGPPANLCAIGDPDQAIYGFRGADRGYFLRFQEDFTGARLLHLHQNYRSTRSILEAATQVIAGNADESRLRLWSDFVDQTKLTIHTAPTDKAEAEYVVHQIEQLVGGTSLFSLDSGRVGGTSAASCAFGDVAILYRTNAQTLPLIEALTRSGIPFQTTGQRSPFEDRLLREVLSYLQVVQQPQAALPRERILAAVPKRAAGQVEAFLGQLCEQSAISVANLIDQVRQFLTETLGACSATRS
jgi:DNA helicase II / ATP-dependent DNA helicase PcrA